MPGRAQWGLSSTAVLTRFQLYVKQVKVLGLYLVIELRGHRTQVLTSVSFLFYFTEGWGGTKMVSCCITCYPWTENFYTSECWGLGGQHHAWQTSSASSFPCVNRNLPQGLSLSAFLLLVDKECRCCCDFSSPKMITFRMSEVNLVLSEEGSNPRKLSICYHISSVLTCPWIESCS